MQAKAEPNPFANPGNEEEKFCVIIRYKHQSFRLDYFAPQEDCEWMAKSFNAALTAHDKEHDESDITRKPKRSGLRPVSSDSD